MKVAFNPQISDFADYNDCEMEIAKSVGFNSPQLVAGNFIYQCTWLRPNPYCNTRPVNT